MKIPAILVLLATAAPLVAHAQTAVAPETLPMAPKSAATGDAFVWRFAPPVGSRWTMRSFKRVISIASGNIDGSPTLGLPPKFDDESKVYKATAIQRFTADYDVLSRDKFGATTIRLTYRELLDYMNVVEVGAEDFTSSPPRGANGIDGATITFKQGPDGRIWSVLSTRDFVRRYLQSNGMNDKKLLQQTLATIHVPSNAEVAEYINQNQGTLPDFPVRAGESWKNSVTFPTMSEVKVSGTRTLKALDANFAFVTSRALFDGSKPSQKVPVASTNGVDYGQLTGTITGTERIERASGLALETNVDSVLKGNLLIARDNKETAIKVTSTLRTVLEPR